MNRKRTVKIILAVMLVTAVVAVAAIALIRMYDPGPDQPIPFSHRIHVTTKKLNCFFCHTSAMRSSNAGMPSVDKCYLCHSVIASKFPPIAQVVRAKESGKGIAWVRVNQVPEHVHFSHQSHLARGIDCGHCHGNVAKMDRIKVYRTFNMNFCVSCHWERKVSADCSTCHY